VEWEKSKSWWETSKRQKQKKQRKVGLRELIREKKGKDGVNLLRDMMALQNQTIMVIQKIVLMRTTREYLKQKKGCSQHREVKKVELTVLQKD